MDAALHTLRGMLVTPSFLLTSSLRVFLIAMRYNFEEEAKIASKYTLSTCLPEFKLCDDLKHISAHTYQRLVTLHHERSRNAIAALDQTRISCNTGCATWWSVFQKAARQEIRKRPTSDGLFTLDFFQSRTSVVRMFGRGHSACETWGILIRKSTRRLMRLER